MAIVVIMSACSQTTVKLSTFWVIIPCTTSPMTKNLLAPQICGYCQFNSKIVNGMFKCHYIECEEKL